jgi:YHS domain-containing protein
LPDVQTALGEYPVPVKVSGRWGDVMKEQKARDPVCGVEVDKNTDYKSQYQGEEFFFCSNEDKAEFDRNPEKYIAKVEHWVC